MSARLEALAVPGGRGRAASARVAEVASALAGALRRAVPFLSRRRVAVDAKPVRCVAFADLAGDGGVAHASAFTVRAAGASPSAAATRGLILLDDVALARILDGVLGGDGSPSRSGAPPTSAQSALASRVTGSMLRAFGDVLASRLSLAIEPTTSKDIEAGAAVVLPLVMDGGGTVQLALPLSAIARDDDAAEPQHLDSGIAAAMTDVELDVVAELGKVRLPLEALAELAVGDVIRLSLPLDERARICAGGATLFHGRPTASGHVVAVAIERPANEPSPARP
ncbi:MAG: FliM/FliN family flagellar motor switch protein [Labilithrix sp.]|nr:FliM/FliN family flagellar motor switch protein [Labilithrix sp.]